jgi:hypothetical protein
MTDRARELAKMLGEPMKIFSGSSPSSYSNTTYSSNSSTSSFAGPINVTYYIGMILIVLFVILLVVHYTGIYPVFSFMEGDGGYIPIVRTNDAQIVWTDGPARADLSGNVTKILPCSFTVQQDIYLENETTIGSKRRVFFYRSRNYIPNDGTASIDTENLIALYPDSNLLMYLLPNTNDLVVSAVTRDGGGTLHLESAPTILNVPIRKPFRLTVVFLPQVLEVYMNGKLFGTKTFKYPPIQTSSDFWGPPDVFRGTVRTMNFAYWDRPLTAMEVLKTPPALPDASKFNPSGMPSASCPS